MRAAHEEPDRVRGGHRDVDAHVHHRDPERPGAGRDGEQVEEPDAGRDQCPEYAQPDQPP
jgi:hypothetical protein